MHQAGYKASFAKDLNCHPEEVVVTVVPEESQLNPNARGIGHIAGVQRRQGLTDFDISYNRYGISPSYAIKLTRGSQSRWIIVLGASGQIIQTNELEEVNGILAL